MSVSSSPALGVWKLELDGRTYAIELADWNEWTGLPGAIISDGASHSLGPWLGGLPQVVSFEVGGHPAALQWAYRAHLVGVPLWLPGLGVGADTLPATTADWWTYELAVDETHQGSWVLHNNEWSFVPPGGDLTRSDPSRRTFVLPVRELPPSRRSSAGPTRSDSASFAVVFVVMLLVVVVLVVGVLWWLNRALEAAWGP
jgi:hypothetical protein